MNLDAAIRLARKLMDEHGAHVANRNAPTEARRCVPKVVRSRLEGSSKGQVTYPTTDSQSVVPGGA